MTISELARRQDVEIDSEHTHPKTRLWKSRTGVGRNPVSPISRSFQDEPCVAKERSGCWDANGCRPWRVNHSG